MKNQKLTFIISYFLEKDSHLSYFLFGQNSMNNIIAIAKKSQIFFLIFAIECITEQHYIALLLNRNGFSIQLALTFGGQKFPSTQF